MMNVVLVGATLHQDNSSTNAANVTAQPRPGGGIRVSGGQFNIGTPNASAIHMNAQADLVGGGDDGLRGLDSVFAGWVNNETANENINGTFQDTSTTPPQNHQTPSVFASNRASASGTHAASGLRAFLPNPPSSDPAPALVNPPLLDTGRGSAGTGGPTATLRTSQITSRTNLRSPASPAAVGQRFVVEAVDSPGDGEGPTHPGFPAAKLISFRFGLTFSAFLSFWTNSSTGSPAGAPADRLYSVLLEIDWQMGGEWSVNAATGAVAVITAPTAQITAHTPSSPLAPAVNTPAEVRSPTGLSLLASKLRTLSGVKWQTEP